MSTFRDQAKSHVNAAKTLMLEGDTGKLIYACLELRLAIEALTYERAEQYADDLSRQTIKSWKPADLLKALVRLDPQSESDITLEIDLYEGTRPPLVLAEKRMKASWAMQVHGALGAHLHARGASRIILGKESSRNALRNELALIAEELTRVLESTGLNLYMWQNFPLTCGCGHQFEVRLRAGQLQKKHSCPSCSTMWHCARAGHDEVSFEVENPRPLSRTGVL